MNNSTALTRLSPEELPEEDIVTRIQTHLDQLATQFYASVRYLSTHHPLLDFDGTPLNAVTSLPLCPPAQPAQTSPQDNTSGPAAGDAETAQEKKARKDKKDKKDKDDGEGAEPASKPPLSPDWTPMDPDPFALDIVELAGDLITKQKQIEDLLAMLPRELDKDEARQEQRIRDLVGELEALEGGIDEARQERDVLLNRVENILEAVGRRGGR